MPQGSDFYQKQLKRENVERCDMEKVCGELEELRLRVRELEELVDVMAKKLDIKVKSWNFWK